MTIRTLIAAYQATLGPQITQSMVTLPAVISHMDCSTDGSRVVIAHNSSSQSFSSNSGASFTQVAFAIMSSMWAQRDVNNSFVGGTRKPSRSVNGAAFAVFTDQSAGSAQQVAVSRDGLKILAARNSITVFTSTNGNNMTARTIAGVGATAVNTEVSVSRDGSRGYIAVTADSVNDFSYTPYVTTNFTSFAAGTPGSITTRGAKTRVAMSEDGMIAYFIGLGNMVGKTTDGGVSWQKIRDLASSSRIACSADGQRVFMTAGSTVYYSLNAGGSWATLGTVAGSNINALCCSDDGSIVYVAENTTTYKCYKFVLS